MTHYIVKADAYTKAFEVWVSRGLVIKAKLNGRTIVFPPREQQVFKSCNFYWVKRID